MIVCFSRCIYCGRRTKHEVCHLHSAKTNRLHRPDEAAIDALPTEEERQAEWTRRWERASSRAWKRHFYREPEVCACPDEDER